MHPNFHSRFTPAEFLEAAAGTYPSIAEERTANLSSEKGRKGLPSLMTAHHGRCDGEEAEHSNDCSAIRDIPMLFDAIQKFKNHFDRVLTFHGMPYRSEIDATAVLLLRR
jgi:hypothetical protein